jgi:hypothetical protein
MSDRPPEQEPPIQETPPKVEDTTSYVLISIPVDDLPTVKRIAGAKKLVKAIRSAYNQHDQQHMFVVKGTLGEMVRCGKALHIAFDEDPLITVPLRKKPQLIQNGWMGDE